MKKEILDHYLQFGTYTYPGLYLHKLKTDLPDDIKEIGLLVRKSIIHRTTLEAGNIDSNADLKYGDMTKVPWFRQPEDDILATTGAMLTELYRRDERGFCFDKKEEDKLVVTCRYVSILIASILKSKGIPSRVRSGFASYFEDIPRAYDHWITQYWSETEQRWISIDVDGSLHELGFDPYDIPEDKFDWSAQSWLAVRQNKLSSEYFWNAMPYSGLITIAWELFYDLHCLMNSEIIYMHHPKSATFGNFFKLTKQELLDIDNLAKLMLDPDKNFYKLKEIWETKREFRLLKGSLL
jgi:hypothetical protein